MKEFRDPRGLLSTLLTGAKFLTILSYGGRFLLDCEGEVLKLNLYAVYNTDIPGAGSQTVLRRFACSSDEQAGYVSSCPGEHGQTHALTECKAFCTNSPGVKPRGN